MILISISVCKMVTGKAKRAGSINIIEYYQIHKVKTCVLIHSSTKRAVLVTYVYYGIMLLLKTSCVCCLLRTFFSSLACMANMPTCICGFGKALRAYMLLCVHIFFLPDIIYNCCMWLGLNNKMKWLKESGSGHLKNVHENACWTQLHEIVTHSTKLMLL